MSKKFMPVTLMTIFFFVIIVCVAVLSSPSKGQAQVAQQSSSPLYSSMRPGRPAITPRYKSSNTASSNQGLSPNKVFSEDDAKNFALSYKFVREVNNNGNDTVTSVQFMTSKEAANLLKTTIGVADNDLVCVVEIKGTRKLFSPPIGGNSSTASFSTSYLIFDGQSGNILVEALR